MTSKAIQSTADEPLPAQVLKFVDAYIHLRDIKKAATEAAYTPLQGKALYADPRIRAEIDRRIANVDGEVDKIIAKRRVVNVEALDQHLMQLVKIPRKTLEATPSLGTPKLNAIELGYRRIGLLLGDDNFVPDSSAGPAPDQAPRIFRATETTILTHKIETHQQVIQREIETPSEPPTIESNECPLNY
jgi:hypothetical protein